MAIEMEEALDKLFQNMGRPRPQEKEKAAFGKAAGELDLLQLHRTIHEQTFQRGLAYAKALGFLEGRVRDVAQDLLIGSSNALDAVACLNAAVREAEAVLEGGVRDAS